MDTSGNSEVGERENDAEKGQDYGVNTLLGLSAKDSKDQEGTALLSRLVEPKDDSNEEVNSVEEVKSNELDVKDALINEKNPSRLEQHDGTGLQKQVPVTENNADIESCQQKQQK